MDYFLAMKKNILYEGHYKNGALYAFASDVTVGDPGFEFGSVPLDSTRLVIWYGLDDNFMPPSHGAWLVEHFRPAKVRRLEGFRHAGASTVDMAGFLDELIGLVPLPPAPPQLPPPPPPPGRPQTDSETESE